MALKPCKECGKEVSDQAKTCPNCGVGNPTTKASDTFLGWAVIIVFFSIVGYACSPSDKTSEDKEAKAAAAEKQRIEDEKCQTDLQCWGEKFLPSASVYCKPMVEGLAKYDAKWTDGTFDLKFSRYRWLDKNKGTITFIGDKIKFQNGFGAFQNHIYQCDFDPRSKQPIAVRASPGTLSN